MRILNYFTENYDSIVFFDVETTGLDYKTDDIIEFACIHIKSNGKAKTYDRLIKTNRPLSRFVTELTGITDKMLAEQGVERESVIKYLTRNIFDGRRVLIVAHNVNFDANFINSMFERAGMEIGWSNVDVIDTLTIFRDRRSFPHKLSDAITAYGLDGAAENTHRAIDDVKALLMVFEKMSEENPDVTRYINLYGYNPKYGIREEEMLPRIRYIAQPYKIDKKLYEY